MVFSAIVLTPLKCCCFSSPTVERRLCSSFCWGRPCLLWLDSAPLCSSTGQVETPPTPTSWTWWRPPSRGPCRCPVGRWARWWSSSGFSSSPSSPWYCLRRRLRGQRRVACILQSTQGRGNTRYYYIIVLFFQKVTVLYFTFYFCFWQSFPNSHCFVFSFYFWQSFPNSHCFIFYLLFLFSFAILKYTSNMYYFHFLNTRS